MIATKITTYCVEVVEEFDCIAGIVTITEGAEEERVIAAWYSTMPAKTSHILIMDSLFDDNNDKNNGNMLRENYC